MNEFNYDWANVIFISLQTFQELTSEISSSVPCQAGFVAPLPSFQFEQDIHDYQPDPDQDQDQDHSLGSSADSNTSESWPTPPSSSINDELTIETVGKFTFNTAISLVVCERKKF